MNGTTLGIVIGALALLLAVPLSVVGNLCTPRVRQWWATTSISRKRRRVEAIKAELDKIASLNLTDTLLGIAFGTLFSLLNVIVGFVMMILLLEPIRSKPLTQFQIRTFVIFGTLYLLVGAGGLWLAIVRLALLRGLVRPQYLTRLRQELERLGKELPT